MELSWFYFKFVQYIGWLDCSDVNLPDGYVWEIELECICGMGVFVDGKELLKSCLTASEG